MTIDLDPLLDSVDILTTSDGAHWPAHRHDDHELLSAITRTVTVVTPDAVYIAPRGTSIWIPAGVVHEVTAAPGNSMRCTWFEPDAGAELSARVVVTTVPPLLDDVLAQLSRYTDPVRRARAEAFALDLLGDSGEAEVGLPTPSTPWLRAVTDALVAAPSDRRTVDAWAAQSSVSVRTFTRQFAVETGMSFLPLASGAAPEGGDVDARERGRGRPDGTRRRLRIARRVLRGVPAARGCVAAHLRSQPWLCDRFARIVDRSAQLRPSNRQARGDIIR